LARDRPRVPPGPYLVVGLARSGVAASLALRQVGSVVACDVATPREAVAERERLERAGVEVHLDTDGKQLLAASQAPRTLVKSPGVPLDAPVVAEARARGIEVVGELEIGWRMVPNEFIAVTGTNGKTTTVELIGAMHRAAAAPVAVAGNVGTPVTSLAGKLDPDVTVVCEASSFQLEDSVAFGPETAVFLNFSEDHLDRHGSIGAYFTAKTRIFANQRLSDLAVVNGDDFYLGEVPDTPIRTIRFGAAPGHEMRLEGGWLVWRDEPVIDWDEVRLRGRFNLYNAMAATAVCLERGLDAEAVHSALREFGGLPHRLEHVAEIGGVEYVNDSKATNIGAAEAALDTIGVRGPVHLIIGGSLKGEAEFQLLQSAVELNCRALYVIGEAEERIAKALREVEEEVELVRCGTLERAVAEAARRARPRDTVLLAPACASFDQFVDYAERGERFRELVQQL
jgi:UDP-N-acetylmuramoylalanine--D-glutamate ligase